MRVNTTSAYTTDNLYDRINESNSAANNLSGESANRKKETGSTSSDYRITFSSGLSTARIQEAMGLNPTGKLKLNELEAVAGERKDFVSSTLSQTMQALGMDPDKKVSLSLDADGTISVSGDFTGKEILEEILNENQEFTSAFKQLTVNQSVIDYVSELQQSVQKSTASLMDYYNSDADLNDLLSIASEYKSLKSGSTMETLLDLSSQTPYTYAYNEGE